MFICTDQLKNDFQKLIQDRYSELDHRQILKELDLRLEQNIVAINSSEIDKTTKHKQAKFAGKSEKLSSRENPNEVLRISKRKIDYLLESFGEQVILQSTLDQCKFDIDLHKDLIYKTISQLTKLTFEIQNHALSLTMVQLNATFVILERAVRDASIENNKKVLVHFSGTETEVDKFLVDALADPLIHLVRNAIDHGIETTEERLAVNKEISGNIYVSARRTGGQLWIEVRDDGKGLDQNKIVLKAIEKGFLSEGEQTHLSQDEIFRMILLSGYSTRDTSNELSGRGVGMSVVDEVIRDLKGTLEIESELGAFTLFRMKLPLSLAIFNGAVIRVNDNKFVIPNSEIAEISRVSLDAIEKSTKNGSAIWVRDEVFQLIDLRENFRSKNRFHDDKEQHQKGQFELPVILTRKNGHKAFVVNEIVGMQKIVQKPLGEEVQTRPEYVAATVLSDGSPGVILDLNAVEKIGS